MASEKQIQDTIAKLVEAAKDKSLPGKFRSGIMQLVTLLQGDSMPGFDASSVIRDDDTTKEAMRQADNYLKNLIPAERKKVSAAAGPEAEKAKAEQAEQQSTTGAKKLTGQNLRPVAGRSNRRVAAAKPEADETPAKAPETAAPKPTEKPSPAPIKPIKLEEKPSGPASIAEAVAATRAKKAAEAAAAAAADAPSSELPRTILMDLPPAELPGDKPTAPPTTAPSAVKTAEALRKVRGGKGKTAASLALGALGGLLLASMFRKQPPEIQELESDLAQAQRRSEGARVAELLEQARMERTVAQNQARLAQADPTLYTSVMAGRRVPTNSVVLGGRPRMDLMKELAASMDSGRFAQRDPLSDLMG